MSKPITTVEELQERVDLISIEEASAPMTPAEMAAIAKFAKTQRGRVALSKLTLLQYQGVLSIAAEYMMLPAVAAASDDQVRETLERLTHALHQYLSARQNGLEFPCRPDDHTSH